MHVNVCLRNALGSSSLAVCSLHGQMHLWPVCLMAIPQSNAYKGSIEPVTQGLHRPGRGFGNSLQLFQLLPWVLAGPVSLATLVLLGHPGNKIDRM